MKIISGILASLVMIGIIAIVSLIIGLPIMLLWNWLMPVIFDLPKITFFQAVGLSILTGILFKAKVPNND